MGGGFALMLAGIGDYDVSSVNYGMITDAETTLADACPVVASYGARDRSLRDAPAELDRVLSLHGVDHDIKVYPRRRPRFPQQPCGERDATWARVAGRFVDTAYHGSSANDARARIIAFFDRHLR